MIIALFFNFIVYKLLISASNFVSICNETKELFILNTLDKLGSFFNDLIINLTPLDALVMFDYSKKSIFQERVIKCKFIKKIEAKMLSKHLPSKIRRNQLFLIRTTKDSMIVEIFKILNLEPHHNQMKITEFHFASNDNIKIDFDIVSIMNKSLKLINLLRRMSMDYIRIINVSNENRFSIIKSQMKVFLPRNANFEIIYKRLMETHGKSFILASFINGDFLLYFSEFVDKGEIDASLSVIDSRLKVEKMEKFKKRFWTVGIDEHKEQMGRISEAQICHENKEVLYHRIKQKLLKYFVGIHESFHLVTFLKNPFYPRLNEEKGCTLTIAYQKVKFDIIKILLNEFIFNESIINLPLAMITVSIIKPVLLIQIIVADSEKLLETETMVKEKLSPDTSPKEIDSNQKFEWTENLRLRIKSILLTKKLHLPRDKLLNFVFEDTNNLKIMIRGSNTCIPFSFSNYGNFIIFFEALDESHFVLIFREIFKTHSSNPHIVSLGSFFSDFYSRYLIFIQYDFDGILNLEPPISKNEFELIKYRIINVRFEKDVITDLNSYLSCLLSYKFDDTNH